MSREGPETFVRREERHPVQTVFPEMGQIPYSGVCRHRKLHHRAFYVLLILLFDLNTSRHLCIFCCEKIGQSVSALSQCVIRWTFITLYTSASSNKSRHSFIFFFLEIPNTRICRFINRIESLSYVSNVLGHFHRYNLSYTLMDGQNEEQMARQREQQMGRHKE